MSELEGSYCCWACGEEIVVPLDPTQGFSQDYVEDCPVCCRPNRVRVELDDDGELRGCWSEGEG
ncbi:MAG: CPXCG motif-containing cysteine-rich protein [Planctomycetota bacterium]|jgi:hypothetical protein